MSCIASSKAYPQSAIAVLSQLHVIYSRIRSVTIFGMTSFSKILRAASYNENQLIATWFVQGFCKEHVIDLRGGHLILPVLNITWGTQVTPGGLGVKITRKEKVGEERGHGEEDSFHFLRANGCEKKSGRHAAQTHQKIPRSQFSLKSKVDYCAEILVSY